ncbi:hypothetical protein KKF34_00595 [Myxococcota bacterium]|nr:hypothetical protein [Myxococcota bacterium]MBU1379414.1 hypothetical protein [Myxococcota bacterium]MBU1495360.1 hypothetical protein [Myxococcota bacterium]
MMIKLMYFITPLMFLIVASCGEKNQKAGGKKDPAKVAKKDFCPLLVAKLGQCTKESSVKQRFNFAHLKKWIYEDCEKTRKSDPDKYAKFYECSEKDCNNLNSCLEQILNSEKQ